MPPVTCTLTLICPTPSMLAPPPPPPIWPKNPLRRTLTISELGRLVDTVDWLPSLSSGSQSKRCMRSTPSGDTRGRDGNRSACFQLRIFCRVMWRELETKGGYLVYKGEWNECQSYTQKNPRRTRRDTRTR